ncbi:MAG TPA: SPASM domain-containing protein [Oscillospiraceae bacterium]|nr:SPASM domain-containing protein [Oscillospiraceae bacterium]
MKKRFGRAYVEITNRCNLACAFCPGTRRAPRSMTAPEFSHIINELRPYTDWLHLHVMGEPLGHPDLAALLKEARDFRVAVTTNGTLLPARGELLSGIYKVNVSLHSFEGNGGADVSGYLEGVLDFAERAARTGTLVILRLWNLDGDDAGLNAQNGEILARIAARFRTPPLAPLLAADGKVRLADHVYAEVARRFRWPDLRAEDLGERGFCMGLRDQIAVLSDGTVVPCCLDHEGDIALGNLLASPLAEILAAPRARALYDGFSRRVAAEPLCRRCAYRARFD